MDCYCENIDAVMVVVGGVTYCDTIETVAPSCTTISCPTGYTLIDGVCQLDSEGTNLCLEGGIYDSLTETCTYTESVLAKCTCTADVIASPQTICSGEETNIILTSTSPGITYNWTVVQGGVTGASSGTGNVISQVLTGVGSVTYIITPSEIANGCQGTPINVLVTVKAGTNLLATPSTPQNIQSGDIVNIGLSSSTPGTTLSWTVTSDPGITGATAGTGTTITNTLTATNSGSVVYSIVATSSNGCSNTLEYTVNVEAEAVELDPFDYIIATYQYDPPTDYDLDTITTFRYPSSTLSGTNSNSISGFIPETGVVGCGTGKGSPDSVVPNGTNINTAYLVYGGDDVGQSVAGTFGESVVINFKNLKDANITTSPDVVVELFAGWQSGPVDSYPITIKYETFIGGTISREVVDGVTTNRYVSNGTSVSTPQISPPIEVIRGLCSAGIESSSNGIKSKVASINFNLDTKVASVTFN